MALGANDLDPFFQNSINASSLNSGGINIDGAAPALGSSSLLDAPYAPAGSITVPNANFLSNPLGWLQDNTALGSLTGTTTGNALDAAGLTAKNTSTLTDIFLRGVVVILGFIFVAVSLTMFGSKAAIAVTQEYKKGFKP